LLSSLKTLQAIFLSEANISVFHYFSKIFLVYLTLNFIFFEALMNFSKMIHQTFIKKDDDEVFNIFK
jgi:hypothetical protein